MAKIEWSPLIDGEEIYANRLTDIGQKIRKSLNSPSAQDNIADRAFGSSSCNTSTVSLTASNYIKSTTALSTQNGGTSGDLWPGNVSSSEETRNRDPLWQKNTGATFIPSAGDQITTRGTSKFGWRFLVEAQFPAQIDLLGDDSNGILVMSEAYVTELYSSLKTQKGILNADTPHTLLFLVLVAIVIDAETGERTKIPLPSTVRFIDSDTNTNNSASTSSPWVTTAGGGATLPYARVCKILTNVRKNMPIRSFVTYSDINCAAFKGTSPVSSSRFAVKSKGKDFKKRIDAFQLFACLKTCSGKWHARGTGAYDGVASIREKSLDAIYFSSVHADSSSELTLNYP
ncbi:MAG: hypothetical protein Unbinned80contig1000_8 [Prokaryotic dsDNA virus sp.]|nr:MAG: hypothetical protein Unbinned80contig1000_8 [Prokaryotic dsDNA virus sp.]|tara:strand:- start:1300 stop:2331 length:1032 start_codon:yes stop_codon:yes gene_type:complete